MTANYLKPFVIAEIGNNHEGNFQIAKKMVLEASKAGVDAVKFQTFKTSEFLSQDNKKFEMYEKFQLSYEEFTNLSIITKKLKMKFISTPLDLQSSVFLSKIVDYFKISSGDNNFNLLIENVLKFRKKTIISTGILKFNEIKKLTTFIKSKNFPLNKLTLMHCISEYPAELKNLNLLSIKFLKEKLKVNIGYSDHSKGILAPIIAYNLGANIIEKHFTLDNNFSNFRDHSLSLNPKNMRKLVNSLKDNYISLGKLKKEPTLNELKNRKLMRRSVYAKKDILKNDIITTNNIKFVRPEIRSNLKDIKKFLGKKSKKKINKDKMIILK